MIRPTCETLPDPTKKTRESKTKRKQSADEFKLSLVYQRPALAIRYTLSASRAHRTCLVGHRGSALRLYRQKKTLASRSAASTFYLLGTAPIPEISMGHTILEVRMGCTFVMKFYVFGDGLLENRVVLDLQCINSKKGLAYGAFG